MAVVNTTDFTGKHKIANDQYSALALQRFIDQYYRVYLARILGADLATAMISDIAGGNAPTDPDLLAIFNTFMYDDGCGRIVSSDGIKETLIGFIYWEFMSKGKVSPAQSSGSGQVQGELITSTMVPETQIYERYNDAVRNAQSIAKYAHKYNELYPLFNGQKFLLNYPQ